MAVVCTEIAGTGSIIAKEERPNDYFRRHTFVDRNGKLHTDREDGHVLSTDEIVNKVSELTGINCRRYFSDNETTSEMGLKAAKDALESSKTNPETLDEIIFATNFFNVNNEGRTDSVPSLASRVKQGLGIKNRKTVAFDLIYGCPGWLQGVIIGDQQIRAGDAKRILVVGAECLSRVSDPYDRDSMIYADGAGALLLELKLREERFGIVSKVSVSDSRYGNLLTMGPSNMKDYQQGRLFLKMNGSHVSHYAKTKVPEIVMESLNQAGVVWDDISKILIHQANAKMDYAILDALYRINHPDFPNEEKMPKEIADRIMPMTISWLGNSSVATLPTLLDLIMKGKLPGHFLEPGKYVVMASIGAGMNINSVVYRVPPKD